MQINKSLKTLFILNSIFVFAGSLFAPLYALYVQGIDNRIITVSTSWAVFMIASTLSAHLLGKFGDRVREKEYLLAIGFITRTIAWFGYIFVNNFTELIIIQIILGIGEAIGSLSWNVLFAKHLDGHHEVRDYSLWGTINNLTVAIATLLGGLLVTFFGFKFLFVIMGLLALTSFVGTIITPRRVL